MNVETDSQAMTEVALGLAMVFFAMMILAMMSMSIPRESVASSATSQESYSNAALNEGIRVAANSKATPEAEASSQALPENTNYEKANNDNIIIFYQNRYLDISLHRLDVASLSTAEHYILALSPDLSLSEVLAARTQISSPNLTITELDEAWMKRLAL